MTLSTRDHFFDILNGLKKRQSWVLIGLGFSAGLPFLLTGATLGFWLRDAGTSLTLIAALSMVSLLYGMKIIWAPLLENIKIPFLSRALGHSRALLLITQLGVFIGLVLMGLVGPNATHNLLGTIGIFNGSHLAWFMAIALWVAFCAASQEIAIDAWRVQLTQSEGDQALNPTFYALGFRIGILLTDSVMLVLSKRMGWPLSFEIIAITVAFGIIATFLAPRFTEVISQKTEPIGLWKSITFPFNQLVIRFGTWTFLIFLICALYRLPDYLIGPIAAPMYQDTGLDLDAIAALRATVGLAASFAGIAAGGASLLFLGLKRTFLLGALAGPLSNICFAWMSFAKGDPNIFALTLLIDNFSNGIAEAALVAFMTGLVDKRFAITQYALLSSFMAFTGKTLKGFSGLIVDYIAGFWGLFNAYAVFFIVTALLAIPALILCILAAKRGIFDLTQYD